MISRLLPITLLIGVLAAYLLFAASSARGEATTYQTAGDTLHSPGADRHLQYGQELFQLKARCISCHGWAGDGQGAPHSAGDAANLRVSRLGRQELIQVISCGMPGTAMPHFNAFAYREDLCFGMNERQVGTKMPPDPPKPLQQREIEVLVDYLQAQIIGHGEPTRAECEKFYGESPLCERYRATTAP